MELDRRLWLTADREHVVEDGDPEAAFLLGGPGDEVDDDEAKRLGIKPRKSKQADRPEDKQATRSADKGA
jgi:hypothetical protein